MIINCLKAVKQSLALNKLKLNPSKTQCMVFSRKQFVSNVLDDDKSLVMSRNSVKNLGVILDCNSPLEEQIRSTVKTCFFHIRNIGKIFKHISEENCKLLANSFVVLNYCNSLYYGLPNILLSRLQRVQNTAARRISCVKRSSHITPTLKKLYWLPVQYRLQFNILLQMYKTAYGLSSAYLTNLISILVSSRFLRSRDADLFSVPRTFSKYGDRRFGVCGPLLWNNLPEHPKMQILFLNLKGC